MTPDPVGDPPLPVRIQRQPTSSTCGPTCLHAVYAYHGDDVPLSDVVAEVPELPAGGTLGVQLATHALRRGYLADIYTYNLHVFDPTWFRPGVDLVERLARQRRVRRDDKLRFACSAYVEFLRLGGEVRFEELSPTLLERFLLRGWPILTGLSATYLHQSARIFDDEHDDLRGESEGHFVVVSGYDRRSRTVVVDDPIHNHPLGGGHRYRVGVSRLIGAVLLGITSYDANLLVIRPSDAEGRVIP